MPTVTLWDTPKIVVWHHVELRIIHHEIRQYCYGAAFREALEAGVDAMEKYGADRWLSDDRKNGPVAPEDDEWINDVWFPRAVAAKWRWWALIPPTGMVGQMNVARTAKRFAQHGITVRTFAASDLARGWLANPDV